MPETKIGYSVRPIFARGLSFLLSALFTLCDSGVDNRLTVAVFTSPTLALASSYPD